ncbi:MAG: HAMP domain-containing sensor histidine kinase [Solibacillus sp.]
MKKGKLLLQLFLMYVVVLAALCLVVEGPNYIGKSYYQTNGFYYEEQEFREGLTRFVLDEMSEEDLRKKLLIVTEDERAHYREYYGSLPEQVENIMLQYAERLEETSSEEVRELILVERDKKIADIKANFEDDVHVDAKIVALKERALKEYMKQYNEEKQTFLNDFSHYNYELINVETNEVFKKGDVTKDVLKRFTYTEKNDFSGRNVVKYIYLSDYLNDGEGLAPGTRLIENSSAPVTGDVTISKNTGAGIVKDLQVFQFTKIAYYILYILGVISFVLLCTKLRPVQADFEVWPNGREKLRRVPVDIFVLLWIGLACFMIPFFTSINYSIQSIGYYVMGQNSSFGILDVIVFVPISFAMLALLVVSAVWQYEQLLTEKQGMLKDTFTYKLWQASETLFLNRKIGTQSLLMLVVVFLAGFGLVVSFMDFGLFLLYIPFFIFVFLPVLYSFIRRMGYLNTIMKHTKDMAEGRLTGDLKVKGKSPLAHHAENLNALRDGVKSSLTEQAKSERMKTELITNVSHDLRTPLTSIITYTDLLKNPELTEEERAKYIGILEVKSARLKTLIEDLFEVSKMASGNMELVRTQVDLAQLLQQTIGEQEEDFAAAGLDLRVTISEQPIFAVVDGQKWWRAIDNLIVNARKYSLEGTRVYVQLKIDLGVVEFIVKNVAKYELNEDAGELVERFKRADTSRHTEGSGLGLAIAQSIVDLHGGTMQIAVDGDLFKVTVKIPMK